MADTPLTDADTGPQQAQPASRTDDPFRPYSSLVQVDVGGLSHTGKVRPQNEDHFLVTRFGRYLETLLTNLPADQLPQRAEEVGYAMMVADGMGGHAAGELASQIAISGVVKLALARPDWILKFDGKQATEIERRAKERVQDVHNELIARAQQDPSLSGMGTTVTIAVSLAHDLQIVHVGDSRAYLLRGDTLHQLTRDHTFVQQLVDRGQMSKDEAARHRMRHILTNVVGGADTAVEVDVDLVHLTNDDRLLLCSDGLTDLVKDEEIAKLMLAGRTSDETCQRLVDLALERGGTDNITVVVARYTMPV